MLEESFLFFKIFSRVSVCLTPLPYLNFRFLLFCFLLVQEILDHINEMYWGKPKSVTLLHKIFYFGFTGGDVSHIGDNVFGVTRRGIDICGDSVGDVVAISRGLRLSDNFIHNLLGVQLIICDRVLRERLTKKRIVFIYHDSFPKSSISTETPT